MRTNSPERLKELSVENSVVKHKASAKSPKKVDWEVVGPKVYQALSRALEDHDETYSKFPFSCIESCWSHDARDLIIN